MTRCGHVTADEQVVAGDKPTNQPSSWPGHSRAIILQDNKPTSQTAKQTNHKKRKTPRQQLVKTPSNEPALPTSRAHQRLYKPTSMQSTNSPSVECANRAVSQATFQLFNKPARHPTKQLNQQQPSNNKQTSKQPARSEPVQCMNIRCSLHILNSH